MMTLDKYSVEAVEYTPIVVKQTITGYGRATKDEVSTAVEKMVCNDGNAGQSSMIPSIQLQLPFVTHAMLNVTYQNMFRFRFKFSL